MGFGLRAAIAEKVRLETRHGISSRGHSREGHFYLAEDRTLLLGVDTQQCICCEGISFEPHDSGLAWRPPHAACTSALVGRLVPRRSRRWTLARSTSRPATSSPRIPSPTPPRHHSPNACSRARTPFPSPSPRWIWRLTGPTQVLSEKFLLSQGIDELSRPGRPASDEAGRVLRSADFVISSSRYACSR